ncbi:MAG: PIN domain nuclease [Corynebacterium sp.]|uniref:PIN domain nuclease n=1 Tax=unclassified Corynebacterium TaxID=2624378 RepID=UPI0026476569|nr:PIN domain nuclease [Corynebacterium sp.]MDN5719887.1 PIN domain nuclease [Corynebacterium sp.]
MGVSERWLIDKSAYARLGVSDDADVWLRRIERGLVGAATVTVLELGYSARSGEDWHTITAMPPVSMLIPEPMTPGIEKRAVAVQGLLAGRGHHRAVKVPDLMIAAVAELKGYTVLHVDKDFELIADVTGQRVERLRGDF